MQEDWAAAIDPSMAWEASLWRHQPTGSILDFRGGGNRPDIKIDRDHETQLVGEVKGRKDSSNVWESWMPQLGIISQPGPRTSRRRCAALS